MEQARRWRQYLRGRPISAVYSSDLARARETAEQVAEQHGLISDRTIRAGVSRISAFFRGMTTSEISAQIS